MNVPYCASLIDPGSRSSQEDYVHLRPEKGIFILADGFGGPFAGAEAAKKACELMDEFLFRQSRDADVTMPFVLRKYFSLAANVVFNSVLYANQHLYELNKRKNVNERGGSSAIVGLLDGDLLCIANVGVCSAWLIRQDLATRLVLPRSYRRMLDPVGLDRPLKESYPEDHAPLMAMGMYPDLEPEVIEYKMRPGDWLILHSDSLDFDRGSGLIEKVVAIKQKNITKEDSARQVVNLIRSQQFKDNLSLLLTIF
jgi:serine/threonine protein phosphatase PrpC